MDLRLVPEANGELIAASVVEHVRRGVFSSYVGLGFGRFVVVRDGVVLCEVVEFGNLEHVRFVEFVPVGLFDRGCGFGGVVELDKREAFGDSVFGLGHDESVRAHDADLAVDLLDDGA